MMSALNHVEKQGIRDVNDESCARLWIFAGLLEEASKLLVTNHQEFLTFDKGESIFFTFGTGAAAGTRRET